MRSSRRRLAPIIALLTAPWLLDCAAIRLESEGEKLFIAGNLPRAADIFERTLVGTPNAREREDAYYYLTMIYATPGSTYDPMRSRAMYGQLFQTFPSSRYRSYIEPIRSLDDEVARLEATIRAAESEIARATREVDGCRVRIAELDDEIASWFQMSNEEMASRRACELALASFRRRIDEREAEITRLHDAVAALEALKRIDTERKPGS